jgi:transcription factor C subunit 6
MSSPSVRRSARHRKPNTKYSTDALDKEVIRLLRESSESSHHISPDTSDSEETKKDRDLDILTGVVQANVTSSFVHDQNNLSFISRSTREASNREESLTSRTSHNHTPSIDSPVLDNTSLLPGNEQGIREHFSTLFGPSDEDTLQILHVRDRWLGSQDATFPSRKALTKTIAEGFYGRTVTGGVAPEKLREQATQDCEWYYDDSGARFRERQRVKEVSKEIAQERYLPRLSGEGHEVVMGPSDKQQIFRIGDMCALDIGEAWEVQEKKIGRLNSSEANSNAMEMNISQDLADTGAAAISYTTTSSVTERHHEGYLLNLGQKVQCLAWDPCDSDSLFQYLAVSCSHTSIQSFSDAPSPAILASNPSPSPPTSSSIQIWAFRTASHSPHTPAKLDLTTKPRLVQVLCTDWGDIQQIIWCPISKKVRTSTIDKEPLSWKEWLGPLAIITSDGSARVLDITVRHPTPDPETQYLHVSSPAFAVSPPSPAICTTLEFASTSDLIIGTSTGALSMYNMADAMGPYAPEPSLSRQLGSTHVSAISNAYPSSHSAILTSSSRSGTLSLVDLRDLSEEAISSNDVCHSPLHLTYSPLARTFITVPRDDGITQFGANSPSMLTCHSIQHFARGTNVARLPGEGPVTALASSRWHPSVLLGTANGCVFSTNYLRELVPQAQVTHSSGAYIQKLCEYEWIPANAAANFSEMEFVPQPKEQLEGGPSCSVADASLPINHNRRSDLTDDQSIDATVTFRGIARRGRSRFHEGFLAERVGVTQSTLGNMGEDFVIKTVFQEQGVTAVDWNPNLSCAGWLAVAWGSGLVRVQDVALGT